jgi:hypothetical protein
MPRPHLWWITAAVIPLLAAGVWLALAWVAMVIVQALAA